MLIIIMEEALLNALNTDNQIRTTAECYLRNIESSPGFLWALFQIYLNSLNHILKLSSLMLARSVISRQ